MNIVKIMLDIFLIVICIVMVITTIGMFKWEQYDAGIILGLLAVGLILVSICVIFNIPIII